MNLSRMKRKISVKAYARERDLTIDAVYKRIRSGKIRTEQDFKGSRIMIVIIEDPPRHQRVIERLNERLSRG